MALPTPVAPLVTPLYDQNRGSISFDTTTKSTRQVPSAYAVFNVCDTLAGYRISSAANINQLSEDCQIVQAGSVSLSFFVPTGATGADMDTLVAIILPSMKTALEAVN